MNASDRRNTIGVAASWGDNWSKTRASSADQSPPHHAEGVSSTRRGEGQGWGKPQAKRCQLELGRPPRITTSPPPRHQAQPHAGLPRPHGITGAAPLTSEARERDQAGTLGALEI